MNSQTYKFRIIGTGLSVPDSVVTNDDIRLTRNPEIDSGWVAATLGIEERRIVEDGVMTSDLAAEAAKSALARTAVAANSIDLLIVATTTPDKQAPATACIVQAKAGLTSAVAFDLKAVCSGFLFGLTTASAYIRAGLAKRALVIGADTFSRVTDWHRRDCVFFGDGAGAAIIERTRDKRSFFDAELYSDGARAEAFTIRSGGPFSMHGKAVFEAAAHAVPLCAKRVIGRNSLSPDDVNIVIPHQPSISLLRTIAQETGVPFAKFRTNMAKYANTAAATIPMVLHEAIEADALRDGDLVMFAAAGAGFTAGAALYRWH